MVEGQHETRVEYQEAVDALGSFFALEMNQVNELDCQCDQHMQLHQQVLS
jgi:hypothetical protein